MSTNPSASRVQLNLPVFDGFPYLLQACQRPRGWGPKGGGISVI